MTPNLLFPGRRGYVGPTTGMFGLLHHEVLFESSHDVNERVAYVKANKPPSEIKIRLHNMIYLGGCDADYWAKRDALYADYEAKRDALYADYWAKRATLDADYLAKRATLDANYEAKRDALYADYWAKRATLDANYEAKRATLDADYLAKRATLDAEVLAYIREHIPNCAWDGKRLVFP